MDNSFQHLTVGNSVYYGRGATNNDTPSNSSHLDHLFDNNNNDVNYLNKKLSSNSTYSINNTNSFYSNTPSNSNSYNNSPLSNNTKSSFTIRSSNVNNPQDYNYNYNSLNSTKTYNSTSPTESNVSYTDNLDECQNTLIRKMNKLQHFKKNLTNHQNSAFKDADVATSKITDAAAQLHRIVEEDKEKLLKEATLYVENIRNELEKMTSEVDKNLKASEELLKFVEELKASCPAEELPTHLSSVNSMMQQLHKSNQDVTVGALRFKACDVAKTNLLGKVSVSDLDTSDPYMDEPQRVGLIEGTQMVAGITSSQDKIYIIRELLPNVEVYNSDLSRHKMLKLEGLRKPSDIAADCLSNHLYISDASGCVFKLNPENNVLNKLAIDVSGAPQGLYVIPSGAENAGNILVTCSDSKQVKEYTNQGDFVRCIKFQQDVASPYHCIAVEEGSHAGRSDRRFVLSHGYESGKPHRVCYVNEKGITLSSFGKSNGSGSMKLDIPNRIALDKLGYVFVADRNNDRVVLLSPNLIYIRDIINKFQKIKQPKRIFLDQDNGWLFVGLVDGNVHIFQLCENDYENSHGGVDDGFAG